MADLPLPDPDAGAVYAAEGALEHWLDQVSPDSPEVRVAGQVFRPEPDLKFTDPDAFEVYVQRVLGFLAQSEFTFDGRELLPVRVRSRRGARKAEYHAAAAEEPAVIAVPPREIGGRWALRALVALHELAHHLNGQPGHGASWRNTHLRLLEALGHHEHAHLLQLAYVGEGLAQIGHEVTESTVEKIAKLLRQGERATNPHERDAFLGRAQRLASTASVALAVARAHGQAAEAREVPTTQQVAIGSRGQRGLARYVRLLLNIARANDVHCTILHGSVQVTLHGFPSDLRITNALYESLLVQMVGEFEQHRTEAVAEEWIWNDRLGAAEFRKPATLSRRLAFYEAFADRVGQRLTRARHEAIVEATRRETATAGAASPSPGSVATRTGGSSRASTTTELAVLRKEVEVHDFFAARLRAEGITSTWRGDRDQAALRAPSASQAGTRAANRARLGNERALS